MSANGVDSAEDVGISECDGEKVVTMMDVLQEQEEFEEDANAVLGASDEKNCTYSKGYIKRQAIYACLTCCEEARNDPSKRAGVCLACSLTCHENHDLIELYTKRNFRCDCGNPKFNSHPCQFTSNKMELNDDNKYNQNFSGLYCTCHRPYPDTENPIEDEMIQCIICEDWLHSAHLEAIVPANEQYAEMICKECMDKNEFIHDYSDFAVNTEPTEVDITVSNGTEVTTIDSNTDCDGSHNAVLLSTTAETVEINNIKGDEEGMDVDSSIKEPTELDEIQNKKGVKECSAQVDTENLLNKEQDADNSLESIERTKESELDTDKTEDATTSEKTIASSTNNITSEETDVAAMDNYVKPDEISKETDPNCSELTEPVIVQESNKEPLENDPDTNKILNANDIDSTNLPLGLESNSVSEKSNNMFEKSTTENGEQSETDKKDIDYFNDKELSENTKETTELESNDIKDNVNKPTSSTDSNENIEIESSESKSDESPEKSALDAVEEPKLNSIDESKLDSSSESKFNSVDESTLDSAKESKSSIDKSTRVDDSEENIESSEPSSIENVDIEMKGDKLSDSVDSSSTGVALPPVKEVETGPTHKNTDVEPVVAKNEIEAESLPIENESKDELESVSTVQSVQTETIVTESNNESATLENEPMQNNGEQFYDKNVEIAEDSEVTSNMPENKRKFSTEELDSEIVMSKKAKLEESNNCVKPKHTKRRFKGATFWSSSFRQKLCTCNECITMYKNLSVLFLIDPEDTVTAYETLGKEKVNGAPVSQYEKGLEALSSLDRIQQINALTEYNKMRDKLLDFLKSFKERKEIVKEEDIKAFFAGMKPKREPDGVYFCR